MCSYYKRGFCKLESNCSFFHPKNLCDQFEKEGWCSKSKCRDRHQRTCKYWRGGSCYRGESCRFSHREIKTNLLKYCDVQIQKLIYIIVSFVIRIFVQTAQLKRHIIRIILYLQRLVVANKFTQK